MPGDGGYASKSTNVIYTLRGAMGYDINAGRYNTWNEPPLVFPNFEEIILDTAGVTNLDVAMIAQRTRFPNLQRISFLNNRALTKDCLEDMNTIRRNSPKITHFFVPPDIQPTSAEEEKARKTYAVLCNLKEAFNARGEQIVLVYNDAALTSMDVRSRPLEPDEAHGEIGPILTAARHKAQSDHVIATLAAAAAQADAAKEKQA